MNLEKNKFWSQKTYSTPSKIDYLYERRKKVADFSLVQKVLGSGFPGAVKDVMYFDLLKSKVITAQNATISETQHRTNKLNSVLKEAKGESGALYTDDEDLADDAIAIQNQINFQSQVKFLQMYFDAYMAPKVSDAQWRLGKVTGTVLDGDLSAPGQIQGGLMYTRSAFSLPFYRQYWDYDPVGSALKNESKLLPTSQATYTSLDTFLNAETGIFVRYNKNNFSVKLDELQSEINTLITNFDGIIASLSDASTKIPGSMENVSLTGLTNDIAELKAINTNTEIAVLINQITPIIGHAKNLFTSITEVVSENLLGLAQQESLNKPNGIKRKKEYYSTMFFPPYKISPKNGIGDFTQYMNDIYANNPQASFDIDSFLLRKDGLTYRDPGFKSLSDYINYLQWIIEGATGIVHTYLTEWDLSLYMQENLMSATVNGAPLKLYLNYRIREDNPMSNQPANNLGEMLSAIADSNVTGVSTSSYTDDRALVFNVAGSSVSKIDFDNTKVWRPSDFPLSVWWLPYLRERDWNLKEFVIDEYLYQKRIPYMDIYDTTTPNFNYNNAYLKEIFKQQDNIGMIMGIWPNEKMKYYRTFYSTPLDSLSDFDVMSYGDLMKVAGADIGVATQKGKDTKNFIAMAKKEMLLNGGYYEGEISPAGQAMREDTFDDPSTSGAGGGGFLTMTSIKNKQNSAKKKALKDVDLNQPFAGSNEKAQEMLSVGLENKVDAASMANFNGINRFSPALFGGPHGSDYNPNTIQAYFDVKSQLLRNIARVEPDLAEDDNFKAFSTEDNNAYYNGLNSLYDDGTKTGLSPAKCLSYLTKGITSYTVEYKYQPVTKRAVWVEVTDYNNCPTHNPQGRPYNWYVENDGRLTGRVNKTVYKTEIVEKEYKANPFTDPFDGFKYNNSLTNNPDAAVTYKNGKYVITYKANFRLADYTETALVPYKKFLTGDEPNVKWEIIQHKFEQWTAENQSVSDGYWRDVNYLFSLYNSQQTNEYKKQLAAITAKHKPVFILKFWQDQRTAMDHEHTPEKRIVDTLIRREKTAATLFFAEGNDSKRFINGPNSIFKASCHMDYYVDVQENFIETSFFGFFKKTKKVGESYRPHPYIIVDIPNAELIADDLQYSGYSNKNDSGIETPVHLNSTLFTDRDIKIHIMQKFKVRTESNVLVSFKSKKTTKGSIWSSILAVCAVVLFIVAFPLGLGAFLAVGALAAGAAIVANQEERKADKDFDASLIQPGSTRWTSRTHLGLSGIGIFSQIPGLMPNAENISAGTTNYNYKNNVTMRAGSTGTKFKDLPVSGSIDIGMKRALLNVYLRPRFLIQRDADARAYNFVPLDTPVRNFLSIAITQLSYYEFILNSLIGATDAESLLDFKILQTTLTSCVDKCILKASGLNSANERIEPDKEHIYYDYWMEQIINLLYGSDMELQEKRSEIRGELQRRILIYKEVIEVLHPICINNIEDWTFTDITTAFQYMSVLKDMANISNNTVVNGKKPFILEIFLFGYLRILYYYRFFFVAKRFNKENGSMWIMRALESVLEFIVPTAPPSGPPPSPSEMVKKEPIYNVAFYELQNTTYEKQQAFINGGSLNPDAITKLYIRVQWCEKVDYERWIAFRDGTSTIEVDEVVEITSPKGIVRYAYKPIDSYYTLISTEYLDNQKNIKWNNLHPLEIQRLIKDYDTMQMMITWGDSPDLTPIRWNVFGEIDVNNLLQYAKESISPDEYLCLVEQGADFWTVTIDESNWPRAEGYRTKIKIKHYDPINPEKISNDPMVNLTGPMAYSIYPITHNQERPFPGVASDNPTMFKLTSEGLGGY